MNCSHFISKSVSDVCLELKTSAEKGLSTVNVQALIKTYGPNSAEIDKKRWWDIFFRQFKSAFIYLLFAAAVIAFLLGEKLDAILIILFVVINVTLGFYQEYKSEQTLKFLAKFIVKKTHVIRDGAEQLIDSVNLVPGDIVLVETGDIIPADLRLFFENEVLIDESTLTGEPVQVRKQIEPLAGNITETYKASNILFAGTTVDEGSAKGIVVSTGKATEFGTIAKLTSETEEASGFEKEINRFSKFILVMTISTLILVFITQILFKHNVSIGELVIFSIALAVSVIPEAMPLVTTFSLSMGAAALAKKHVVVKRLSAIEDLGGIQVLCTDKTGTITENSLTVSDVFADDIQKALLYGYVGAGYIESDQTPNNSFDLAIYNKATQSVKDTAASINQIYEIPFNPNRRRDSVLVKVGSQKEIIVRGAVESVLPFVKDLSETKNKEIINWTLMQGSQGKRVLAIARRDFDKDMYSVQEEEKGLEFIGLISFNDPIKGSTISAVEKAKKCGITIKILTGDSAEVAGAVAFTAGIAEKRTDVITGNEFFSLPHNEQVKALANYHVFARVSPEEKFKLIQLMEANCEVGYLGDGINDAPALKVASVAIVVDTAADVSREVADIVLLKNDLQVVVDGIELGRKTFVNVTNYIKATLASNFGNFYAMAFATLVIDYLPMLPIQILMLNLLSDFPMVSIATDNVEESEIRAPKTYEVKEIILVAVLLGLVSTLFDFIMFAVFKGGGEQILQTYWFMGSILTELVIIYLVRTRVVFFKSKVGPSIQIVILTVVAAAITVGLPFLPIGASVFNFIRPTLPGLGVLAAVVVGYIISTEIVKKFYYSHLLNSNAHTG